MHDFNKWNAYKAEKRIDVLIKDFYVLLKLLMQFIIIDASKQSLEYIV